MKLLWEKQEASPCFFHQPWVAGTRRKGCGRGGPLDSRKWRGPRPGHGLPQPLVSLTFPTFPSGLLGYSTQADIPNHLMDCKINYHN